MAPQQWHAATAFYGWTPYDEIAHLCYFDEAALQAVRDAAAFRRHAAELSQRTARGDQISAIARATYAGLSAEQLLARWQAGYAALIDALALLDSKARLPWYGPDMSARSFATARLMETWAHGQDIWDLLRRRRPAHARLKHIAHLGVTTFSWTFVNRALEVPSPQPHIELLAPDGERWRWGEASATDFVRGDALEFCLLVTQRRHLDDTALEYAGAAASRWLPIAQCFAGAPADAPAAGVRKVDYA